MAAAEKDFFAEYDENTEHRAPAETFIDSDREYPVETRCCITGEEVKHGYCRYPDFSQGTMMIMSRDSMIRFSRMQKSLSVEFERVLSLRREQEKRKKKSY